MLQQGIEFKGRQLSYKVMGDGPAILLLHGFLESASIWEQLAEGLSADHAVIMPDLPGHGQSESLGPVHGMDEMAAFVKAVLDAEEIGGFVVAGHSMGGYVALELARQHPRMVRGLCLFHSHAAEDSAEGKINRDRTIEVVRQGHQHFIHHFIPDLFSPKNLEACSSIIGDLRGKASRMGADSVIAALEGMKRRNDSLAMLEAASFPLMFIAGQDDKRMPYELVLSQAALFPECTVQLLRDTGHMGWAERPGLCLDALRAFGYRCEVQGARLK